MRVAIESISILGQQTDGDHSIDWNLDGSDGKSIGFHTRNDSAHQLPLLL
jgi:hypothetical protein